MSARPPEQLKRKGKNEKEKYFSKKLKNPKKTLVIGKLLCYNFSVPAYVRTDQKEGINEEWKLLCLGCVPHFPGLIPSVAGGVRSFVFGKSYGTKAVTDQNHSAAV